MMVKRVSYLDNADRHRSEVILPDHHRPSEFKVCLTLTPQTVGGKSEACVTQTAETAWQVFTLLAAWWGRTLILVCNIDVLCHPAWLILLWLQLPLCQLLSSPSHHHLTQDSKPSQVFLSRFDDGFTGNIPIVLSTLTICLFFSPILYMVLKSCYYSHSTESHVVYAVISLLRCSSSKELSDASVDKVSSLNRAESPHFLC